MTFILNPGLLYSDIQKKPCSTLGKTCRRDGRETQENMLGRDAGCPGAPSVMPRHASTPTSKPLPLSLRSLRHAGNLRQREQVLDVRERLHAGLHEHRGQRVRLVGLHVVLRPLHGPLLAILADAEGAPVHLHAALVHLLWEDT